MPLLTSKAIAPIATAIASNTGPEHVTPTSNRTIPSTARKKIEIIGAIATEAKRETNSERANKYPGTYSTATHTTTAKASMSHIKFPKSWFPTPTI